MLMENIQKQNKILKIIIIILLLLLLCGGIYFYTNNLKQKDNNTNTPVTEKYKNNEDFVAIEDYYVNDVTIKKVNFKNLDTSLIKDFTEKQDTNIKAIEKLINNVLEDPVSKEQFKDIDILEDNVWTQINDNILTVYQEYNVNVEMSYTYLNTVNIDLKNKKVLSNEEVLNLANTDFSNLATEFFNKEIADNKSEYIFRKSASKECNTNDVVTKKELTEQKDTYIKLIKDNLDSVIYSYIKDGKVHYKYAEVSVKLLYQNLCIGGGFTYTDIELT